MNNKVSDLFNLACKQRNRKVAIFIKNWVNEDTIEEYLPCAVPDTFVVWYKHSTIINVIIVIARFCVSITNTLINIHRKYAIILRMYFDA